MRCIKWIIFLTVLLLSQALIGEQIKPGAGDVITSVPRTMTYQGILKDSGGAIVPDSSFDIVFRIWDDQTAGIEEWSQTIAGVETGAGGYFTAELTNLNIPFDEDYWMEIEIVGDTGPMVPRQKLTMSPYSASGGGWVQDGANVRLEDDDDYVGIGASNPDNRLHVEGTGSMTGGFDANSVVARFKQTGPGLHSAISIDALSNQDAELFYASDGIAKWVTKNDNDASHKFKIASLDPSYATRLTLTQDGKMGLGTLSPNRKLHVFGGIYSQENPDGPDGLYIGNGNSIQNDSCAHIKWIEGSGLSIHSVGREYGTQLFIDGDSRFVGIGHSDPSANLHIKDLTTSLILDVDNEGTGEEAKISFRDADATADQVFEIAFDPSSEDLHIRSDDNGGEPIISIEHEGNVEIGTSTSSGNESVVLPQSSVSAFECFNEPGITQSSGGYWVPVYPSGWSTITSESITTPAAGYVLALAVGSVTIDYPDNDNSMNWVDISVTDADEGGSYFEFGCGYQQFNDGNLDETTFPYSIFRLFYVDGGLTKTYELEAIQYRENCGACNVECSGRLLLMYFPTSYGSVNAIVEADEAANFSEATPISSPVPNREVEQRYIVDLRELELRAAKAEAAYHKAKAELLEAKQD